MAIHIKYTPPFRAIKYTPTKRGRVYASHCTAKERQEWVRYRKLDFRVNRIRWMDRGKYGCRMGPVCTHKHDRAYYGAHWLSFKEEC